MGGLLSKPKTPPPPDPSIAANARKREARAERETVNTRRRMAARKSARQRKAMGLIMAGDPAAAFTEIRKTLGSTLGAGRNPRGPV